MYGELQAVAEWLAQVVIHSKPKKHVSCHLQIGIGVCKQIRFITHLWADESKGRRDILMAEITNIINGEIDPFEEEKNERN